MDELAVKLDMDPVELRRVNDSMKDATGKQWSSRSLMKCYDQAAEALRLEQARREARLDARRRLADRLGLRQRGLSDPCRRRRPRACGCMAERQGAGADRAPTRSAPASVRWSAQMAAERLGIPVSAVTVETGDSALPPSPVAGGSNPTASCCSVVMKACDAIKAKLSAAPRRPAAAATPAARRSRTVQAARRRRDRGIRRIPAAGAASPTPSRSFMPASRCSAAAPRARS